jgi:hypothetical protein
MFRAAARYRLAMHGSIKVHDRTRVIAWRVAHDALRAEEINCLNIDGLAHALMKLGEYDHRYDRQEEQLRIIASFYDLVWFSKILV